MRPPHTNKQESEPDIPVLDEEILEILAQQTTPQVIPELIQIYLEDATRSIARMQKASREGNWRQIGSQAHSLKSSSGAYGAMQVYATAKAIEQACQQGNIEEAAKLTAYLPQLAQNSALALRKTAQKYARNKML